MQCSTVQAFPSHLQRWRDVNKTIEIEKVIYVLLNVFNYGANVLLGEKKKV